MAGRAKNRWIRAVAWHRAARGRAVYGGMSTLSTPDPAVTGESGPFKNTANTNVTRHAGRILCLMEGGLPTQVTAISDRRRVRLRRQVTSALTAHPHVDGRTGEMLAFSYIPSLRTCA
jgi:carotenoid cleavage dioxygenase